MGVLFESEQKTGRWVSCINASIRVRISSHIYEDQHTRVKEALHQNGRKAVTTEMGKWFKMLRNQAHGIDEIAASELMNFAMMVTPVQEYNISVPGR